ncbi:MAG: PAS domain S-box protein [Verrucomicrobia bacterium]|nr:PAS domain S-box protein [Verrucomicrobiota bacterium]
MGTPPDQSRAVPAPASSARPAGSDDESLAALRESRRVLATLLSNLPGMAYRCRNDGFWTMEFVSGGCSDLTGYAPDDLVGNRTISFEQIIHPQDRDRVRAEVATAQLDRARFELRYRITTRGGEVRHVMENGVFLRAAHGETSLLEGFIFDVTGQRRAEEALAEKERTLTAILDHSFQFIGLLDTEGRVLRANETALRAVGARPEQVNGEYFWDTPWWSGSPARQNQLRAAVKRAAAGGFVRYETTHPVTEGRVIHVDFSLTPVRAENGQIVALIPEGRDITEQKQTERALRESEEKFARAFRASPDAISVSDAATGLMLDVNEGFERLSGLTREEVIGRTSQELGLWTDPNARDRMVAELRTHGSVRNMELVARAKDGTLRTFLLSAEKVVIAARDCLVILSRDITDQKNAEHALRESEQKFAKAFRASPYALTITDLETGRYLDINAGFERLAGYVREEVIGRTSLELGMWADPADRVKLVRALRAEGSVRGMEFNFQRRDGARVTAQCSCELIEINGLQCILNAIEDITEQRKGEAARAALESQLRQAQKLDALGQLAGGIAHDFNNILTGVIAYSELAALDAEKPAEVRRHIAEVLKAGRRAKDLVRQILAFSRQQIQERKPVTLTPVVQEAVKLLRSTLPKTIEIEVRTDPLAPVVLADPSQIHQVMMNLCTNAAHAMRDRPGRLTITLDAVQVGAAAGPATPGLRPGRHARLTIRDSGHGMTEETLRHIFEPFFTTKPPGEGTGLGLAVVRGIIEDHDGAVTVQSRPGEGSTFQIHLPEHTSLTVPGEAKPTAMPRGAGERILLIDDEKMIVDSSRTLLNHLGYKVTAFIDPGTAITAFQAAPAAFDLVVTDLMMPRITGIEVVRQVRAMRANLPVLMVSGYSGTWTPEGLRALGVSALVAKPMTSSELAVAVRRTLDGPIDGALLLPP